MTFVHQNFHSVIPHMGKIFGKFSSCCYYCCQSIQTTTCHKSNNRSSFLLLNWPLNYPFFGQNANNSCLPKRLLFLKPLSCEKRQCPLLFIYNPLAACFTEHKSWFSPAFFAHVKKLFGVFSKGLMSSGKSWQEKRGKKGSTQRSIRNAGKWKRGIGKKARPFFSGETKVLL